MKRIIKKLAYRALARDHYSFYKGLAANYVALHNDLTHLDFLYGVDEHRGRMELSCIRHIDKFNKKALQYAWVLGPTTCHKPNWFDRLIIKLYGPDYIEVFVD